jgi:hypothetical protein
MLQCAGNRYVKTPAMDRIAAAGVRFERAYATNPVCIPSRVSMMTGYMPSRFGMRSNSDARNQAPTWAVQQSLGHLFRKAGYRAAYGGKTHWLRGMTPETLGFENVSHDEREALADACGRFFATQHDKPFLLVASFINPHDMRQTPRATDRSGRRPGGDDEPGRKSPLPRRPRPTP